MGKSWKNPFKVAQAQKKGQIFTKLAREIQVSAKLGGGDPDANSRLKMAINAAREQSCPKDTIERAIKKGTGELDAGIIEELTYEGYGPHGVGVIVECQTDNRNRTASEIRSIFGKNGGNMGESGCVSWMFQRTSLIEGKKDRVSDPEEEAIEVGANEVDENKENNIYSFYGAPEDLDSIRSALQERGWEVNAAELSYIPTNITDLSDEQLADVTKLLDSLEENDDSHRVYATIK
ncbi:MAG: YebC/PmpR family DNA-binding transcriptional regulator [Bdellovibrionaceae bacterium]|nr:YebC/PmpR family DNA-binding transcriptional regulator [Pseudobdellovibrionaceae bacterium]